MNIKVKHLIFFSVLATVVVDTLVFYTFLLVTFFSKLKTFCPIVYLCLEKKKLPSFYGEPKGGSF